MAFERKTKSYNYSYNNIFYVLMLSGQQLLGAQMGRGCNLGTE